MPEQTADSFDNYADAFASEAMEAVAEPSNVSDQLNFLVTQALAVNLPEAAYGPDLIRAAAVATGASVRDASRKLKAKYGKDFSLNQWNADVRDAKAALVAALPSDLIKTENGSVKAILANAIIQMKKSGVQLGYDTFANRVVIHNNAPWGAPPGPWRDMDDISASNYLQHQAVTVPAAVANEAGQYLAWQNPFHPVRDWLLSLTWDGEPRLDTWMVDHLGAPDDPYLRAVSAKWVMSAVARAMRPGIKCDYMIVLEGQQRQGKSRALRALTNGHLDGDTGVQWFRDALPDIDHKDIGIYMQGVWIIEIAELEAIRGKQWTKVKSFISSQTDSFRKSYGRNLNDYPRQCVFAGSTTEDHWGGDPTGLTRFWPVRVTKVNVDAIMKHREQIWAEARFRYDEGEKHYLSEDIERLARGVQADRAPDDPWMERVERAIVPPVDDITMIWLLDKMEIPKDRHEIAAGRIARVLSMLGWKRYRDQRVWRYKRPEEQGKLVFSADPAQS